MGALTYEPEISSAAIPNYEDLDAIADETLQFQENDNDRFVDDLLAMNGSSAGARPKIVIATSEDDWIIKFRSFLDPKDIGPIEYGYHLMAKSANLDVPKAKLFPSKKGYGYFGVKRFDKMNGKRTHVHTISGLLHVDHRVPSLDYETIMKATMWLTKDHRECEKQFRASVFNVLSHNRDDHAKNFSFVMNTDGKWLISPSYDLTFSSGPSGEHCSTVMGEGKKPSLDNLLKLAEVGGIKKQRAMQIISEVKLAISDWNNIGKNAGVSSDSLKMIKSRLDRVSV